MVKSLGYVFIRRELNTIYCEVDNKDLDIKIVEKFTFTSDRKRMSVLVEIDGQIYLYTKGVLLPSRRQTTSSQSGPTPPLSRSTSALPSSPEKDCAPSWSP